jgi:NAD(P)-dependent dehydrogenase (short-subunit alcohol dehydrogenase family)
MRELHGMSILVTGGASGIGRATAAHLAAGGARVTILGRREDRVAEAVDGLGPQGCGVVGDVTVAEDRSAAVAAAVEHGGGRLDALLNNAGNMYRGPIDGLDEGRLLELFHTNVVGAMLLTGEARPHLERTAGCVLFVGSVHTQRAFPGASPYAATKGAVEALTGVLAAELGPAGIRVACVRPGAVPTEINVRAGLVTPEENLERLQGLAPAHALGRIGTAVDVAEAFEYLIRAEWVTGAILNVDGGLALGVTNA